MCDIHPDLLAALRYIWRMNQMNNGKIPYSGRFGDPESWHESWNNARALLNSLPDDIKAQFETKQQPKKRKKIR